MSTGGRRDFRQRKEQGKMSQGRNMPGLFENSWECCLVEVSKGENPGGCEQTCQSWTLAFTLCEMKSQGRILRSGGKLFDLLWLLYYKLTEGTRTEAGRSVRR